MEKTLQQAGHKAKVIMSQHFWQTIVSMQLLIRAGYAYAWRVGKAYQGLKPWVGKHASAFCCLPDPDGAVCAAAQDALPSLHQPGHSPGVANQCLDTHVCLLHPQLDIPYFDAGVC